MSEAAFRDHLLALLREAGVSVRCEPSVFRNWDQPYLLRADIIVGPNFIGCDAVIECKTTGDVHSLSTALGQAVIYRRAFGATTTILCFPSHIRLPGMFLEVCQENSVLVASETTIVGIVDPTGKWRAQRSTHTVAGWIHKQNPAEWTHEQRDAWRGDLEPIVEFHARL